MLMFSKAKVLVKSILLVFLSFATYAYVKFSYILD